MSSARNQMETAGLYRSVVLILTTALLLCSAQHCRAQFTYTTNNGTITITSYTGSGGDVLIPNNINGYPITVIDSWAFSFNPSLTSVTIPNGVTNIGIYAFASCPALTSVTIPSSVISIGSWAFNLCSSLTNIAVDPANADYVSAGGGLIDVAQATLMQCPGGLTGDYTIPTGVTNIADHSFESCSNLTGVTIPNTVITLGNYSFKRCDHLKNVIIPNSVTSINVSAFESCNSLTNVVIGNSVTSLGNYAFYKCLNLTSATISDSVTNIGFYAFTFCPKLTNAFFEGNAPIAAGNAGDVDTTVFYGDHGTAYYIPGTAGWGATFGGLPTAQWHQPQPQMIGWKGGSGVQGDTFQFTISWATNTAVVVETSTNLQNWTPVATNTLVDGTNAFADSAWRDHSQQFYRVRSQ